MRTTLILKDDLLKKAMQETGISEKTALIHLGLEELLRAAAYKRLAQLGGTSSKAKAAPRRK
jgi:Arc/MetJ family transcription regulator